MSGPYFFENDDGKTVTVNSEHCGHIITHFFLPAIEEYDMEYMWLQQDGVTCHATRANMILLKDALRGHVILVVAISAGHQDHSIWHHLCR